MLGFIGKRVAIVTLLLGVLFSPMGELCAQRPGKAPKKSKQPKITRLQRKALKYEDNIKKIKTTGRVLLEENEVNYAKLDKLKKKIKKLSLKAEKCRYKEKTKRHIKVQDRPTKKRMRKSLRTHRKHKKNTRHGR